MKRKIAYLGSALVVAGALAASLALASEKARKFDLEKAEMMKEAEAACTPGPAHQALEALVGESDAEIKTWMDPGAPSTISKGPGKSPWVLKRSAKIPERLD